MMLDQAISLFHLYIWNNGELVVFNDMRPLILLSILCTHFCGFSQLLNPNEVALSLKGNVNREIYDLPDGNVIIELDSLSESFESYILMIDSTRDGWARITRFLALPLEGRLAKKNMIGWIKTENLESALQPYFSLYEKPENNESKLILRIENNYTIQFTVGINEVKNNWVNITFSINNKELTGWVVSTDLCPLKHTTCNYPW